MILLHIKSKDFAALQDFCDDFKYSLRIEQGRAAQPEKVDGDMVIPAQPAIGDTAYYYTTIMLNGVEMTVAKPIELADPEIVKQLCGEWL